MSDDSTLTKQRDAIPRPADELHRLPRSSRNAKRTRPAVLFAAMAGGALLGALAAPQFAALAITGAFFGLIAVSVIARRVTTRRLFRQLEPGVLLAARGEHREAIRFYEGLLPSIRPRQRGMALAFLAGSYSEVGEYERALELANEVYDATKQHARAERALRIVFAHIYLDAGDPDTAEPWLQFANDLRDHPTVAAKLWARDPDRRRRVLTLAPKKRRGFVAKYTQGGARALHLIKAFVADLEGDAAARDQNLRLAHPAYRDEHEPLVRNWPELREFLHRHPLEVVPCAPSAELPKATVVSDRESR